MWFWCSKAPQFHLHPSVLPSTRPQTTIFLIYSVLRVRVCIFSLIPSRVLKMQTWKKKSFSICFISLSTRSKQQYRLLGACYTNALASILMLSCCGPSQDVHECKTQAWIIDGRNDLLHNAVFSFFNSQLFLCDKTRRCGEENLKISVVKLGELTWDFFAVIYSIQTDGSSPLFVF